LQQIATDGLSIHTDSTTLGADDINPIIVYATLKTYPRFFYSNKR